MDSKEILENRKMNLKKWVTLYRLNLHIFATHYLGLRLRWFQCIYLYLMNIYMVFNLTASRGIGKSFLSAVYCVCKCILYPGTYIVVTSGSKNQAEQLVTEKIESELCGNYPNIAKEIKQIKSSGKETKVLFHNGSIIEAVTPNDKARGRRANVVLFDEYRQIKEEIVGSVFRPFLTRNRQPPFLSLKKYKEDKEFMSHPLIDEQNTQIYISSAYYKQNWMWSHLLVHKDNMVKAGTSVVMAADYKLGVEEKIINEGYLTMERETMSEALFQMEFGNEMSGMAEGAAFDIEGLQRIRSIEKPFYPWHPLYNNFKKCPLKKQKGEIRIVGMDVAKAVSNKYKNDATIFTCLRLLPMKDKYERQLVHVEGVEGMHGAKQTLRLKQLYHDFNADYVVLDARAVGETIVDYMSQVTPDNERDVEYEPWTSINDEEIRSQAFMPNALPIVYTLKATDDINDTMIKSLRELISSQRLKLPTDELTGKQFLIQKDAGFLMKSKEEKVFLLRTYEETNALINEMVNLEAIVRNGKLAVKEKSGMRKDRYSSLGYANYYADILEREHFKQEKKQDDITKYFITGSNKSWNGR